MALERGQGNSVSITHTQLSKLLGVRRESTSSSANALQKDGIIAYCRGNLTVLNRKQLNERACECYGTITKEYARLLPNVKRKSVTI